MLYVRQAVKSPMDSLNNPWEVYGYYKGAWYNVVFPTFTAAWIFAHTRNTEYE